MLEEQEITEKIESFKPWYQNILLPGDIPTNPENADYPQKKWEFISNNLPHDLSGKTVLDIGCNAGFFSIKMKELGAKRVLGIDSSLHALEQAKFVSSTLGLDIEFKLDNVYNFLFNNHETFDYIVFVGVLYHLRYPLLVLDKISEITKQKLIFQTTLRENYPNKENIEPLTVNENYPFDEKQVFNHPDFPKMFFIEKRFANDYSNWWFCNETGTTALLRSSGFCKHYKIW